MRKVPLAFSPVNTSTGIKSGADLKGKRFGIPDFQMTAGLWMRAMVQDLYDVRPQDVTWYVGRRADQSHGVAMGLDQDPRVALIADLRLRDQHTVELRHRRRRAGDPLRDLDPRDLDAGVVVEEADRVLPVLALGERPGAAPEAA